jgi:hypothetical protein
MSISEIKFIGEKMRASVIRGIVLCLLVLGTLGCGEKPGPEKDYLAENRADKDARMQWWREARFGMFIHWGLYVVPAGERLLLIRPKICPILFPPSSPSRNSRAG